MLQVTETIESTTAESVGSFANGFSSSEANTSTTMERQYETAETEQVSHMEQEEKKTFVITGNWIRKGSDRIKRP